MYYSKRWTVAKQPVIKKKKNSLPLHLEILRKRKTANVFDLITLVLRKQKYLTAAKMHTRLRINQVIKEFFIKSPFFR